MNFEIDIKNVKAIKSLHFVLPLEPGLYAITGENSSGKSTLVTCISASIHPKTKTYDYFGRPAGKASIEYKVGEFSNGWLFDKNWRRVNDNRDAPIKIFFEGSIIYGNRFKDAVFSSIKKLDFSNKEDCEDADDFIRKNLGLILHGDENYYKDLFVLKSEKAKSLHLSGTPFFYTSSNGSIVHQSRMSTGENLLVSILHYLSIIKTKAAISKNKIPFVVLLDEIELALHASSLRRLTNFLNEFSKNYKTAIFFSTHSLELIRDIKPSNIYYLSRMHNDQIIVTNPCYPAFATRNLFNDDCSGYDLAIFVEDDLAKMIVTDILKNERLYNNIRISVIPTGGWTNTLLLVREVISSKLVPSTTRCVTILDKDIKGMVSGFLKSHKDCKGISISYLPIKSLEKYLKHNLFDNIDAELLSFLDNYVFQGRPIKYVLDAYSRQSYNDNDGKRLYGMLINELRSIKKDREDLVSSVLDYIRSKNKEDISEVSDYLKSCL